MALIAGSLGILLAFSSMLLSWYILVPHTRQERTKDGEVGLDMGEENVSSPILSSLDKNVGR